MPHTFHFVALECIKQQEPLSDEIAVLYHGNQAFPVPPEIFAKVRKGDVLFNGAAPIPAGEAKAFLRRGTVLDVSDFYGVEEFLSRSVPTSGLGVQVIEKDQGWSQDDVIGQFLVSPIPTPVTQTNVLTGSGAEYRFSWLVVES